MTEIFEAPKVLLAIFYYFLFFPLKCNSDDSCAVNFSFFLFAKVHGVASQLAVCHRGKIFLSRENFQ